MNGATADGKPYQIVEHDVPFDLRALHRRFHDLRSHDAVAVRHVDDLGPLTEGHLWRDAAGMAPVTWRLYEQKRKARLNEGWRERAKAVDSPSM
jgi:hypothetical protein